MAAVIDIGSVEVSTADHAKKGLSSLLLQQFCHEDFTMDGEDNIHTTNLAVVNIFVKVFKLLCSHQPTESPKKWYVTMS